MVAADQAWYQPLCLLPAAQPWLPGKAARFQHKLAGTPPPPPTALLQRAYVGVWAYTDAAAWPPTPASAVEHGLRCAMLISTPQPGLPARGLMPCTTWHVELLLLLLLAPRS